MAMLPTLAIAGGGPGGLMLARLLQVRGIAATVFERDPHAAHRPQGGSLDLHEQTGLRALELGGLEGAFRACARPEDQGDRLYDPTGTLLFDHDGSGFQRPEIDRTALRTLLLESLEPATVRWGAPVLSVQERTDDRYDVVTAAGTDTFDIVIGADGAWSRVRPLLSSATPSYEGVVFIELGFEAGRHRGVDDLTGRGKMFAVGDNRVLIAQRNGHGHIRGYAAWRAREADLQDLGALAPESLRATALKVFAGWAPRFQQMLKEGAVLGFRPLYALPVGHRWTSRPGLSLLGDAAHLMSPFAGEGVNMALADALDLATAITDGGGWDAVTRAERVIAERAQVAAQDSADGLRTCFSSDGAAQVLKHYRERVA